MIQNSAVMVSSLNFEKYSLIVISNMHKWYGIYMYILVIINKQREAQSNLIKSSPID